MRFFRATAYFPLHAPGHFLTISLHEIHAPLYSWICGLHDMFLVSLETETIA